jgi:hypothetical protein
MSRQNKVNPGMYTQRGRLTQDDAAREIARQRVVGSQHTWQPVQRDRMPKLAAEPDHSEQEEAEPAKPAKDVKRAAPAKRVQVKPARTKSAAKPVRRAAKRAPANTVLRAKAKTASGARRKAESARPAAAAKRTSVKRRKS